MRKNKFINPSQKRFQSSFEVSPNKYQSNNALVENKIYFPVAFEQKLMPYKLQLSAQMKLKIDKMNSSDLYGEKEKSKTHRQRKSSFKREKKFSGLKGQGKNESPENMNKTLIKNKTMELKKLPGISCTASGKTIYRSKNIKSLGKFIFNQSSSNKGKKQLRRNFSGKNQESVQSYILSKRQKSSNPIEKKAFLYQTYFSSKPYLNQRSNSNTPAFQEVVLGSEKQEILEKCEDLFCKSLIQTELYGGFDKQEQQQFF